jgi:colanic acid/amylovoran biosynthesis glycosyltransferase
MKLLYVTSTFPFGVGEGFLVPEIAALGRLGNEMTVVPLRRPRRVVHADAQRLAVRIEAEPLLAPRVLGAAVGEFVRSPRACARVLRELFRSRTGRILAKNLIAFPKALWLARRARVLEVEHIHAHWAATTATLALVAGELTGIPWSLTAHRWDIAEDNLLALKLRRASYVRAINELGAQELACWDGDGATEPEVLHMGVELPSSPAPWRRGDSGDFRILTAAFLYEVKGHADLADALALLVARGYTVRWDVAGDGPLRGALIERISRLGLEQSVSLLGFVSHDALLDRLGKGEWSAVVLPSVETAEGVREGIPVSLIEALAHGVPVVATATGGIPELLEGGAGLTVPPRDPAALAAALERLLGEPGLAEDLARCGRERVERDFSVESVAVRLQQRFEAAARY